MRMLPVRRVVVVVDGKDDVEGDANGDDGEFRILYSTLNPPTSTATTNHQSCKPM